MASVADSDTTDSVTLHSSWKGIVLSGLGALLVVVLGLVSTLSTGGAPVPLVVLALGVFFVAAIVFDYPIASRFTADGVERRPLLRRHFISWDGVDQLTRARPALRSMLRGLTPGGLTAKVGRRRYLLVDQCEALAEFEALGDVLEARYVTLGIDEMVQPPTSVDPTWTYRRKQWMQAP